MPASAWRSPTARPGSRVRLEAQSEAVAEWKNDLTPASPLLVQTKVATALAPTDLTLRVLTADGRELIRYTPIVGERGEVPRRGDGAAGARTYRNYRRAVL